MPKKVYNQMRVFAVFKRQVLRPLVLLLMIYNLPRHKLFFVLDHRSKIVSSNPFPILTTDPLETFVLTLSMDIQ